MNELNNLHYWNQLKNVPDDALKKIAAGRLKGMSDINPQWRYEIMTQVFGPCGVGWKYTIDKQWTEQGSEGQVFAFVNISLYVCDKGTWSEPIPGNGGSMLIKNERNGAHDSDEAFKMATTDALGTAMKMLGVASEVYRGHMDSKYNETNRDPVNPRQSRLSRPKQQEQPTQSDDPITPPQTLAEEAYALFDDKKDHMDPEDANNCYSGIQAGDYQNVINYLRSI